MKKLFVFFTLVSLSCVSVAQAASDQVLKKVTIEGNQRIENQTILSYVALRSGLPFTRYDLDRAMKALFATGFFSDVEITPEDGDAATTNLTVKVTENPIINQIAFEGNKRLDDEALQKEINLRSRAVFSRTKVQNDAQRLVQVYRRNGRYSASVDPQVITLDNNRVNLVFSIKEGPETMVQKITFVGNKVFRDQTLRNVVKTEEATWWNPFSSNEKYDPDRLQYDQELLRRFYVSQGYADFQVKSAIAELAPSGDGFYLTLTVDEGERYQFGEIKTETALSDKGVELDSVLTTKKDTTYNADEVENSIEAIVTKLGDEGFAFVDVSPEFDRDEKKRKIAVDYKVNPGPKVYVERININGNSRTLDEVIRREFRFAEGDPYNTSKLARTEQRLNNLGFFEKVAVTQKRGSAPDQTVVDVDVQEQSTGEISVGAGFSTVDGPLADFGITERNLLGKGQELRFKTLLASRRQQYDIGFTEPYFLDRELAAGFDLFKTLQDFSRESAFDRESTGGALRLGYALNENLNHDMYYRFENINITNVNDQASRFIKDQAGTNVSSLVGQALTWDKRNNRFEPTDGWYVRLSQEFAGVGGDSRFARHEIKAVDYFPIAPQWTFQLAATGGNIAGIGRDVRINERFFIGGRQLRGFEVGGIGPRDRNTRDALGGNLYYTGSAELQFPLGLPDDLGFSGAVFTDVGSLWSLDVNDPGIVESNTPRVTSGVGIAWKSPFGPIRLDFAKPIVKQDEDVAQFFNINFGTRF
jgi:outer membrane protein insertion porin family